MKYLVHWFKLKLFYWRNYLYYIFFLKGKLDISDVKDSVAKIIEEKCSISRFGDGEIALLEKGGNGFQKFDNKLAQKLDFIILNPLDNHYLCIPGVFNDFFNYKEISKNFWLGHFWYAGRSWESLFKGKKMLDTQMTRFYMAYKDKSHCSEIINLWKQVWDNREIVFIEGYKSRMGVGNDLFNNSKSIQRILCPAENAFDQYDRILATAKTLSKDKLIIIALGQTATVLAYDLANEGYQALDLGHIDIEYEWFLMGATEKVPIPHKYVNEVNHRNVEEIKDENYSSQIIFDLTD